MTEPADEFDAFPFAAVVARELDRVCLEFESAWRRGGTPVLSEFLDRVPAEARAAGAELLVEIEVDALRQRGTSPEPAQYAAPLAGTKNLRAFWEQLTATPRDGDARPVPLPDRFELLEELGRGGMGDVYKARHRHLDRIVAVKVLRRRLADDDAAMSRFRNEVRVLAGLSHPGIAAALDADFVDGYGVLVLEYVEGTDLHHLILRDGPLGVADAVRIIGELAGALAYAHARGIVHRDVKPANVMLTPTGEVKLLDLGIAELTNRQQPDTAASAERAFLGTPEFAAPEQVDGAVDARGDVYSLGCTFYHILTGHPPFPAGSARAILEAQRSAPIPDVREERPDVPPEVERILQRLLAKQPNQRPADMDEVLRSLDRVARRVQVRNRRSHWTRRGFIVAGVAAAGGVVGGSLWRLRPSQRSHRILNSVGMELVETLPGVERASVHGPRAMPLLAGVREVTRQQFRRVMGDDNGNDAKEDLPATDVTWLQASEFCRRLSERTDERLTGRRYRLLTEVEWLAIARSSEAWRLVEARGPRPNEMFNQNVSGLLDGTWEWCDAEDSSSLDSAETGLGAGLPARQRRPILGAAGLFIHNFDLWGDHRDHLAESDGIRLREEPEGRTRYFEPAAPRRDGKLVYAYELPGPVVEASLFAKILAHRPTSSAWLEISGDGSSWNVVDEGYVHNSHESPRDVTAWVAGSRRVWVRLRVREESELTWLSQALRTSPNPELQFPYVYQLFVVTSSKHLLPEHRVLAPVSMKHSQIGFRVACEEYPVT